MYQVSIYLSFYLPIPHLSIYLSWDHWIDTEKKLILYVPGIYLSKYLSKYISIYIHIYIYLSWDHWIDTCPVQETDMYPVYIYLTIYLSIHLSIYLSIYLYIHISFVNAFYVVFGNNDYKHSILVATILGT